MGIQSAYFVVLMELENGFEVNRKQFVKVLHKTNAVLTYQHRRTTGVDSSNRHSFCV